MQIIGLGTDIIECARIGRMLVQHGDRFTRHVYSDEEIRYCSGRKVSEQHFAGRWAAKEAVLKAFGTGWIAGISWRDVEVVIQPGGKPTIRLHRGAAEKAAELGIGEVLISISHCKSHATATAIAVGEPPMVIKNARLAQTEQLHQP